MRKKSVTYRAGEFHQGCFRNPDQLLQVKWRNLSFEELDIYLKRVVISEYLRFPINSQGIRVPSKCWLASRFRTKRLAVIERYIELGGKVSLRATAWSLPRGRHWPGALSLVGTYTDEDIVKKSV